jgi:hypothetical protein
VTLILAIHLDINAFQIYGNSKIVIDWMNYKENLQVMSLMG